jgi:hypothetical protein
MDCARIFAGRMDAHWTAKLKTLAQHILSLADKSLNSHRALLQLFRIGASLAKLSTTSS